ncbi:Alginate biosynthesis protein Alg8 [Roseibacterium elongatum DSM 19469]|uniref:Alginate biosynthesis protein Alg8 n=1 Tax=Roseicyclus elongatus DSM 19469 TaxID=1294273 RepID=W8RQY0_9RHOB|nr:glycosyltransferase [Roseibacterium elongatum]AHM03574.1 Alginate biosynthesis protein Alg8 [Roseibacterium elongatum DSM 19469]
MQASLRWWAIYCSVAIGVWYVALSTPRPEASGLFFTTIGIIALWRYSWWLVHQVRSRIFLKRVFPRLRAQAERVATPLDHVYAVVLSYNIDEADFVKCYASLIDAAVESDVPTTIVASITTDRDRRLLHRAYLAAGCPEKVEIIAQFQKGDGKRSAIGEGLRVVARDCPPDRSVTILMDGDTVLGDGAIARVLPFFSADPDLAAATTNNDAIVKGTYLTRNWYVLRLAQRHTLMASMALSKRLLVLTGRCSFFRTDIATSRDFIAQVEDDRIWHWRLGEIKFLTGDDKSTWFHVLRSRGKMLYVPDVVTYGLEELPAPGRFFPASTKLMQRWFGNMLRANARAVSLGTPRLGFFVWWSLLDQRVSIWSSLAGPVATILLAIFLSPLFIIYYLAWAILTRTVMALATATNYGRIAPVWPFLLYYNQVWGALMKSKLLFHLDRQSWTRQSIDGAAHGQTAKAIGGTLLHAAAVSTFVIGIGVFTGQLSAASDAARYDLFRVNRAANA